MSMSFPSLRATALGAGFALLYASQAMSAPATIPFSELRSGMKGIGKTVFHGDTIDTFDVEIVGLLPNIGPGQNLILGRCTGGPLAQTGILAGMSGSPVTIDGKLVGAVAYSWGFSKDAIAGITPIEEMLAVGKRGSAAAKPARPASAMPWGEAVQRFRTPSALGPFFVSGLAALSATPAGASALMPLSVSGIGPTGLARISHELARAGFVPLQAGGAARGPAVAAARLAPGAAVGVKLVRGDIDMTATGTVTWVDGDALYAFGHPLYGLGDVDLPMTAARVETLLPSIEQSSKIAVPLGETGAFRQDRSAAIYGRLGATPSLMPVRLQIKDGSGERRNYTFDLVADPLLSPLLLYLSMNGLLGTVESALGSATIRLREGSVIKVDGATDIRLDNLFAGDGVTSDASGLSAFLLYLVMNNEWSTPRVSGINLILDYDREPRTETVRRVTLDRYRVKAGTTVTARVVLSPYRGDDRVVTREIEIPEETPDGPLTLQFGGAAEMSRAEDTDGPVVPRSLEQLVTLVNRLKRNDRLYVLASRGDNGLFLGGARLPNLPPGITSILTRPRSFGNFTFVPQRGVLEDDIAVDGAVEGFVRVSIDVVAP
jgi:hypothetical protein